MLCTLHKLILKNNLRESQYLVTIKLISPVLTRFCCDFSKLKEYEKCYKILGIANNSDQETVRRAFIDLCKKYHPDSAKTTADTLKFHEIESAYRLLQNKFASDRWNVNDGIGEYGLYYREKNNSEVQAKVFDIKHTAPQHRQYLSYDGIGSGTPLQREKQYTKFRAAVAVENVSNHHVKKIIANDGNSLLIKDKLEAKKVKTRFGVERLVEDLILESMAKGQFNNLKGQGKPLPPSKCNPYVDFVTHKINEIMIDNGFAPDWINLQKEIADETNAIKQYLLNERKKLGSLPFDSAEEGKWKKAVDSQRNAVEKLNNKINKFNLVVPVMNKQKMYFNLDKESCDILKKENSTESTLIDENKKEPSRDTEAIFSVVKL